MGLLSKIFPSRLLSEALDLGVLEVDMHSHLIPGIDDGAKDMRESIQLIKGMHALGYKKLITTPHIMADFYPNTPEIINKGLAKLQAAVKKENIDIIIEAAAEYLVDEAFVKLVEKDELLSFGNKYLLIELSYFQAPPMLNDMLFELQVKGYNIILAHPERYAYWHNDFAKYEELKNKDIYFQINMSSLSDYYGVPCRKVAEKLLQNNMVEFLGSDVHNHIYLLDITEKLRYQKSLQKALRSGNIINKSLF